MHQHEWALMYDGDSKKESVEIFALCIADQKAGKGFITFADLLNRNLPDICHAKLSRKEIEEKLNELERIQNVEI